MDNDYSMTYATLDSLVNLSAHLGDYRDKQAASSFAWRPYSWNELETAYRSWLPKKMTRMIPEDMIREGRQVTMSNHDPDGFNKLSEKLSVLSRVCDAMCWGRLYGGGGAYMVIDKDKPETPLDISKVSPTNPIVALIDFDRWDVETRLCEDARAPNFLRPEWYRFTTSQQWIHWTRVLGPFEGYRLPNRRRKMEMGWGGSEVEAVSDVALQSLAVNASVASLMHRADSVTVGVKGLLNKTQSATRTAELQRRFAVAASMMSNNSFFLYDMDAEQVGQVQAKLTEIGSLMSEFLSVVAAALGVPVTRFFGTAPKGLNATGEGDRKNYNMDIKARQTFVLNPEFARLDPIIVRSVYGVDAPYTFEWRPLEQPSGLEKAQEDYTRAQTHLIYMGERVIQPSMVSQELLASGEYDALTQEYVDALATIEGLKNDPNADDNADTDTDTDTDTGDANADTDTGDANADTDTDTDTSDDADQPRKS